MQISINGGWRLRFGGDAAFWFPAITTALLLCAVGCTSTDSQFDPTREPVQMLLPRLTEVMTGPAAGLLTNLDGYRGEFTATFGAPGERQMTATGEILERDGKLCFQPVFKKAKRKNTDAGAFTLIWDAVERRGYVLSEGLQGFAPVAAGADTNQLSGLHVERANDLNGLATRIDSPDTVRPFTFSMSDIKPGLPPPDLFVPPDGFTKYDSEGALLGELAARQRTVIGTGQKREGDLGPYISEPGVQRPRTQGY